MHLVGYLYEDYHDARSLEHKECPFGVNNMTELRKFNNYIRQWRYLEGYDSTKCAGNVGSICIFQLNRSINSKWQFSDCATIAFSERYYQLRLCFKTGSGTP
jgi:hypothetical protein